MHQREIFWNLNNTQLITNIFTVHSTVVISRFILGAFTCNNSMLSSSSSFSSSYYYFYANKSTQTASCFQAVCPSINTYFTWHDISEISGGNLMPSNLIKITLIFTTLQLCKWGIVSVRPSVRQMRALWQGLKSEKYNKYKKLSLSRRKSATKFHRVKTFSGKVVRHSLADLTVCKWLVSDVPFYVKFSATVTHPLQKRQLPIDILL